jgi:hypothetical protein
MSMYLPLVVGGMLVCLGLSRAIPAWRSPLMVVGLMLMAATVFAPDLAPGLRVLAAGLTAILAVVWVLQLRQS